VLNDDLECVDETCLAFHTGVPKATFCVLLYGDYADLARRCLESVREFVPRDEYRLRIGMNACAEETVVYVDRLSREMPLDLLIRSDENLHKYPMMRKLFWDKEFATDWVVWLDDDAHSVSHDWWRCLWPTLAARSADAAGQLWWKTWEPGQWDYVTGRKWFRGVPPMQHCRYKQAGVSFMTGSYWVVRTDCLRLLDWPDRDLLTRGDKILCEAMRQQGWRYVKYDRGMKVNDAPTRTVWMAEPGSTITMK